MNINDSYRFIAKTLDHHLDLRHTQAFIFGSRTTNQAQKYSDIDIGLTPPQPIPLAKICLIKEALENSDIPYLVDLVDFSQTSGNFKSIALKKTIDLKTYLHD